MRIHYYSSQYVRLLIFRKRVFKMNCFITSWIQNVCFSVEKKFELGEENTNKILCSSHFVILHNLYKCW